MDTCIEQPCGRRARVSRRQETVTKNTKNPDALQRQLEALQERVARLSAAVLRVSASLDLDTVLQEAVDSARALTGAGYGAVATVDEAGRPRQFLSSGITPEEHGRLAAWSGGPRLFEHLRDLPSPMRVADVPAYLESLGLATDLLPYKTMQATPMRHRGVHVGSFYLTERKGGRAFTDDDEEVLVLFGTARDRFRAPGPACRAAPGRPPPRRTAPRSARARPTPHRAGSPASRSWSRRAP